MAVSVSVYDLVNYPDNNKTVTVDIKQVTPIGYEGDEQWVISCVTSAYSDNTARTAIQDIYVQNQRSGWLKGMQASGPFTIASGTNGGFEIKLDADATWRHLDITPGNYTGDDLADWLEDAIRALHVHVGSTYELAYMNMSVKYEDGRFQFVSGSVSQYYTGSNRSAVTINGGTLNAPGPGGQDNCARYLGLDFPMTSEGLAAFEAKEGRLDGSLAPGSTAIPVKDYGWDATTFSGSVFALTTDNTNWEYVICIGGSASSLAIYGADGSGGVIGTYADEDKIIMFDGPQDPSALPTPWHEEIDSIVRWGIKSISNQIDFSS